MYKGKRVMKKEFDCFKLLIFSATLFTITYMMAVIVQAFTEPPQPFTEVIEETKPKYEYIIDEIDNIEIIETTTSCIEIIEEENTPIEYTIQQGDTPWEIAKKFYSNGNFYPYLMKTNNITNFKIGDKLIIENIDKDEKENILKECLEERYKIEDISIKTTIKNSTSKPNGELTYLGDFKITGYDPWCKHCCSRADGITASGTLCAAGRTIATDRKYPFGTKMYIEGLGTFTVEDRGVEGNHIDVVALSHEEAYKITRNAKVYLVS